MSNLRRKLENIIVSNKIITEDDVFEIVDEYIREYNLEPYLNSKNVYFINNENSKSLGWYNPHHRWLVLVKDAIAKFARARYRDVSKKIDIDFNRYFNLLFLWNLIHELKHIVQYKALLTYDSGSSIYGYTRNFQERFITWVYDLNEILKGDSGIKFDYYYDPCAKPSNSAKKTNDSLYNTEYARMFPCEREASIYSFGELLTVMQQIDKKHANREELRYFQMAFVDMLLEDYHRGMFKVKNPIQTLLKENDGYLWDGADDIFASVYLPVHRRLELGLPIKVREYDMVEDVYFEIKKRKIAPDTDVKKLIMRI